MIFFSIGRALLIGVASHLNQRMLRSIYTNEFQTVLDFVGKFHCEEE